MSRNLNVTPGVMAYLGVSKIRKIRNEPAMISIKLDLRI